MNFDEYSRDGRARYAEFANTVRSIVDRALEASGDAPRPQAIQARAKEPSHLQPKLAERALLESDAIESEIKDLAGVRVIFYTNTDVERFLAARLIPDNFDVEWEQLKIHYPTPENDHTKYQAIHYIVSLNAIRTGLPEYERFVGLRCEIQIQTVLDHAWAETSHDILYKNPLPHGFGGKAFQAMKKRMDRVMEDLLVPAGYELQKVQSDFDKLKHGLPLFVEGPITALKACADNNARLEVLQGLREYVLPYYDDLEGLWADLLPELVAVVAAGRATETRPIETTFGDLPGHPSSRVTTLVNDIISALRYLDVGGAFRGLVTIYREEADRDVRKHMLESCRTLAEYNLATLEKYGLAAQALLLEAVDGISSDQRDGLEPILITIWQEILSPEFSGTSWEFDTVSLQSGALRADANLAALRERAIAGLLDVFDWTPSAGVRRNVVNALNQATRLPYQSSYGDELTLRVTEDTTRIVEALGARVSDLPYDLQAHIEHQLLFPYRRAAQIMSSDDVGPDLKVSGERLRHAIVAVRDALNGDPWFVRFKTLVGFDSVSDAQWENDELYNYPEDERLAAAGNYVAEITGQSKEEWRQFIEACAGTESNDGATFIVFGQFVVELARRKPAIAAEFFEAGSETLVNFLPGLLNGLAQSSDRAFYRRILGGHIEAATHLAAVAKHWWSVNPVPLPDLQRVLTAAIALGDEHAVLACVVLAARKFGEVEGIVKTVFIPGVAFLGDKRNVAWVGNTYFLPHAAALFGGLSPDDAAVVLDGMFGLTKLDHDAERVLACIAASHGSAVWAFLERRILRKTDSEGPFEAIPYQLMTLNVALAADPALAVQTVFAWYEKGDPLFRFNGARLLSTVFPGLPETFADALLELVQTGPDEVVKFVLDILENYRGDIRIHAIAMAVVARLPQGDPNLARVEWVLENTGVVSGAFGFADAYRRKKEEMSVWLKDDRQAVRDFAHGFVRHLEIRIASEHRKADQGESFRRRAYDPVEPHNA